MAISGIPSLLSQVSQERSVIKVRRFDQGAEEDDVTRKVGAMVWTIVARRRPNSPRGYTAAKV
jgi:hypothetical protein